MVVVGRGGMEATAREAVREELRAGADGGKGHHRGESERVQLETCSDLALQATN